MNTMMGLIQRFFEKSKGLSSLLKSLATLTLLLGIAIYIYINTQATMVYQKVADVPKMPVAIVFGAGIDTAVLADRVNTAVLLYRSGKIQKMLMTGDNGHVTYNEPDSMKALAVASGVPLRDIACDYAGFRTYDSLYRARDIFNVQSAILVTQKFHLPRAMFIAKQLGISAVGIDASLHSYGAEQYLFMLREIAATEVAWWDVMIHRKPKFLGKKEPIIVSSLVQQTD